MKNILEQQPLTSQEFEQWYEKQDWYCILLISDVLGIKLFYLLPFLFQQGVYAAYFRSVRIVAYSAYSLIEGKFYPINVPGIIPEWELEFYDKFDYALTAALQAAAQLREKQLSTLNK